jgi:predicted protein tyrosine phosphatase
MQKTDQQRIRLLEDHYNLIICGREETSTALTHPALQPHGVGAVVSLGRRRPCGLEPFARNKRLVIGDFEDIVDPNSTDPGAPQRAEVEALLDRACTLYKTCIAENSKLLVHCEAGISRSTSVALSLLARRLGPGREQQACEIIAGLRPPMAAGGYYVQACPNERIVGYADDRMNRGGALIDACEPFWDGSDGFWTPGRAQNSLTATR